MKILLLSPGQLIREFIQRPLLTAGHEVTAISSLDELTQACLDRPELVFLPARIGDALGSRLAAEVKESTGASVILFSPDDPTGDRRRDDPVDAVLRVPFSADDVTDLIGVATRAQRLILLADDSDLVHRSTVPYLEETGYTVISALDGNEALALAFQHVPDLVVTDVEMPGADGYMVCQTLKQDPRTSHVPVIIASSRGETESLEQGFDAGADDYLVKPVIPEDLLSRIHVLISEVSLSGRERILVVDDSPAVRHLVADTLKRQGFGVAVAEDGKAGLALALEMVAESDVSRHPQMIITDYDMPEMNGFEFVHALKQDLRTRSIPAMMLTARESRRDQAQMRAVGLTSYLVKPFTMDKCIAMVERILAERRLMAYKAASQLYLSEGAVKAAEAQAVSGQIGATRAEELELSVLFSDICGFTSMSGALSPYRVVEVLNEYFDAMCPIIREHGGDIDKFIGDAIMAVFPTHRHGEDPPPLRAVRAALEMQRVNEELFSDTDPPLQMRIGINTGPVVRGDIGSKHAPGGRDFTVIGDTVNRAQRLESSAPRGGVLISESTHVAIADLVEVEAATGLVLKGVAEPVSAFVVKRFKP